MYYSQQGIAKSGAEQLRLDICAKNPRLRQYPKRYVQAYPNTPQIQEILIKMSNHRIQILETIENLVEARDIIFTQIVKSRNVRRNEAFGKRI